MTLSIGTFENYLGNSAENLLSDEPFKDWFFERSLQEDLEEKIVDYLFPNNGIDFTCGEDGRIRTIFLYSDAHRLFDEGLSDIPFSLTRQEVADRLGAPSKSGKEFQDAIFGACGAWDRFDRPDYSIHIRYRVNADCIDRITLMRSDVVPT